MGLTGVYLLALQRPGSLLEILLRLPGQVGVTEIAELPGRLRTIGDNGLGCLAHGFPDRVQGPLLLLVTGCQVTQPPGRFDLVPLLRLIILSVLLILFFCSVVELL